MSVDTLSKVLDIIVKGTKDIFGGKLVMTILYGSYARGDYDSESDMDIAVLLNIDRTELCGYNKRIASLMTDLSLDFDLLVTFSCIPIDEFEKYKEALPYYRSINQEGVKLSA